MRNLSEISGLPLWLDQERGLLTFGPEVVPVEPGVRRLGEMRGLLAEDDSNSDEKPCYLMYRDVRIAADEALLQAHGMRYDITVTLPGQIGRELMKTAGHYHSFVSGRATSYPEVYEVLAGQALFLLQRVRDPRAPLAELVVEEVLLISAGPGERLIIPPHCGHVTINAGSAPLVVSDLIARACENSYGAFLESRGAAYYVHPTESAPMAQPNPFYHNLPALRQFATPAEAGLALEGPPLYQAFRNQPERFAFLK
jgi:glucose-6-phosphate isomerase